jgi:TolB-like protein
VRYRFEKFVFDSDALELRRGDDVIDLQPKVLHFLGFLLENHGRTVAQRELMNALWPSVNVGLDSLTRVASLARRSLEDGAEKRILETRRGLGYRIGVPVQIEAASGAVDPVQSAAEETGGPGALAVLPFDNLGPNEEDAYFADGLSEDLIIRLSRTRMFSVIARSSSFDFRGKNVDLAEVGRELGVRYVVLGSVRRAGGRVRVNAQLVEARTRMDLWADRYDRDLGAIFSVQDDLVQAIVSAIVPNLSRAEQHRAMGMTGNDLGAWDTMLKGLWHYARYTREGLSRAESLFRRATELDPNLVDAWANLANCLFVQLYYGWADDPIACAEETMQIAQRAITADDENPTAHFVMAWGHLFRGDHESARIAAERAIELNPSDSTAHWALGVAHTGGGRADQGAAAISEAIRLSPRSPGLRFYLQNLGIAHLMASRFEDAAECARRALALGLDQAAPHRLLAACHGHLGRKEQARDAIQEAMRLEPEFSVEELRRFNHPAIVEQLLAGWRKGEVAVVV